MEVIIKNKSQHFARKDLQNKRMPTSFNERLIQYCENLKRNLRKKYTSKNGIKI